MGLKARTQKGEEVFNELGDGEESERRS